MFGWLGPSLVRFRWAVLAVALIVAMIGGFWGTGVFGQLVDGGFEDPGSESAKAAERIVGEVGRQDVDVFAIYSSETATVDDSAFSEPISSMLAMLRTRPEVSSVRSFYETGSPAFVSKDRHATFVAIALTKPGDIEQYKALNDDLEVPGLRMQLAGGTAVYDDVTSRVSQDIVRAELYSLPVLAALLLFVFGSAAAAALPLFVGGLVVLGSFCAVRVLTWGTDVSVFSINIITLLGMGLAIDYALFMVSRFREELATGSTTAEAVERSVATAGRTIAISGAIVTLALASLMLFPQLFLRSMGLGGMAAVLVAVLTAVTVLPALLTVLGKRVNALPVRLPRPFRPFRPKRAAIQASGVLGESAGWARLARAVMRRPVIVVIGTVGVLLLLALPFTDAEFSGPDERVLPAGAASRVATERLAADFPGGSGSSMRVLVSGAAPAQAEAFASQLRTLPAVTAAAVTAGNGESHVISVGFTGSAAGPAARELVWEVRSQPAPEASEVMVAGRSAELVDLLDSLSSRLPWMVLTVMATTAALLGLAFRSIVLPLKAIAMSVASIGASFGAVVWAFQQGHLAGLLKFTATGELEASQLILMLAIIFGLSTDYEVFLLSRVREEWLRTADNVGSVAAGLQRTGQIITSAALLLVVVIGGFLTGGISFIKMIGIGMIVAIIVDATIVRVLLVPATMRLLGPANWWLPGPLRRRRPAQAG